jgi:hypothetical protein
MRYDYSYFADGRLKQLTDLDDIGGQPSQVQFHYMSRAYAYNHTGQVSGVAAVPNNWALPAPFSGSYSYDAFNNLNSRSGVYGLNTSQSDSATYTNNRRVGWTYDADGRVTASADSSTSSTRTWSYNAAGEQVSVVETASGATATNTTAYDGNGELLYESVVTSAATTSDYMIHSSVLGAVLTKLDAAGNKDTTYVPANGLVMPLQQKDYQGNATMRWVHRDASGLQEDGKAYDPFGGLIQNVQPPTGGPPPNMPFYGPSYGGVTWSSFSNANNLTTGCKMDGVAASCDSVMRALGNGTADLRSLSTTGTVADFFNAGFGGLVMPFVNSRSQWKNDAPPKSGGPPRLQPASHHANPHWVSSTPDSEGGPGHWETSFEINYFLGAVFGSDPQNTALTSGEVDILASDLKNLLNNAECAAFIEKVLKQLKSDTGRSNYDTADISELFSKVKSGRGFDWRPGLNAQARGGGGYDHNGNNIASISLKPTLVFGNLSNTSQSVSRGLTIIHELFHVAGYDHQLMARAVYNAGGRFDSSWKAWRGDFPRPNDPLFQMKSDVDELDGAYSGFFKNVLEQKCK